MAVMGAAVILSAGSVILNGRRQVHTELSTALIVARASVASSLTLIEEGHDQFDAVQRLIRTFDGSRNIEATLSRPDNHILLASEPSSAKAPAPAWLVNLLKPSFPLETFAPSAPQLAGDTITLRPIPINESSEVWADITNDALFVLVFLVPAIALIWWTTQWVLSPLSQLVDGMSGLRHGHAGRLSETQGPKELRALTEEFNRLVRELAAREGQAVLLEAQLARIQAEERADIARDLHDDIGPLLFLAKIDLASLKRHPVVRINEAIGDTISGVVRHLGQIQTSLRDIVTRLQSHHDTTLSIEEILDNALKDWRERFPSVIFDVDAGDMLASPPESVRDTISRVITEAVSNAFQHAKPTIFRIGILETENSWLDITIQNDGVIARPPGQRGFGIQNMRERVVACGGQFKAFEDSHTCSWLIQASMPLFSLSDMRSEAAE
jgi:two-component system sensor histidine kinase UhpB